MFEHEEPTFCQKENNGCRAEVYFEREKGVKGVKRKTSLEDECRTNPSKIALIISSHYMARF